MKSFILLLISLCIYGSNFGQNQTSVLLAPVMPNGGTLSNLMDFPNDPTKLLLIEETFNQNTFEYEYDFNEYDPNGGVNTAPILGCNGMTSEPFVVTNGILFGGNTVNDGVEPVFFNGQQSDVLDVNPGPASSNPQFFDLKGRLFFTAFDGNFRQLYEYISSNNFVQLTSENDADVTSAIGHNLDEVFYTTTISDSVKKLKKTTLVNGNYMGSTIRNKTGLFYYWSVLGEINNQSLFCEASISYYSGEEDLVRILSVNKTSGTQTVLNEDSTTVANLSVWKGVNNGGELLLYHDSELFKTSDGLTYSLDQTLSNEVFSSHFNFNNDLFFITSTISDSSNLIKFTSGASLSMYSGRHLHPSIISTNEVYLTDLSYGYMSKYLRLNGANEITVWNIKTQSNHPRVKKAATYFNSKPVFLWESPNPVTNNTSTDIHTISSFLSLENEALSENFTLFPNPVIQGESVRVNLNQEENILVIDQMGRVVFSMQSQSNEVEIGTSGLSSGMYLIKIGESQQKLIVK